MKCNVTVDVGADSMYTNAVTAFSAGIGGKENDAVASTSDFTATSGKDKVNKNSSGAPSTSASRACS